MKRKVGIALLLITMSINLSASMLGKITSLLAIKGADALAHSCAGDDMKACYQLGNDYNYAMNGKQLDETKAKEYYKKACDGKYYSACGKLSQFYQISSADSDKKEAARLQKLACDHVGEECYSAGLSYMFGIRGEKNLKEAMRYFKKYVKKYKIDCAEETSNSVCKNIAKCKYAMTHKIDKHPYFDKALALFTDECNNKGNTESCRMLRVIYDKGVFVGKNEKLSEEYNKKRLKMLIKSCNEDSASSCQELTYVYSDMKDIDKLTLYARKAQNFNDPTGLRLLAEAYASGSFVKADKDKAKKLYLKASKMYEKKCKKGDGDACYKLAYLYQFGEGVEQDSKKAGVFNELACNKGVPISCHWQNREEDRKRLKMEKCVAGDANICKKVDPDRALKLYKERCEKNDGKSCYSYAEMTKEFI